MLKPSNEYENEVAKMIMMLLAHEQRDLDEITRFLFLEYSTLLDLQREHKGEGYDWKLNLHKKAVRWGLKQITDFKFQSNS